MKTTRMLLMGLLSLVAFSTVTPAFAEEQVTLTLKERVEDFSEGELETFSCVFVPVGLAIIATGAAVGAACGNVEQGMNIVAGITSLLGVPAVGKVLYDGQSQRLEEKKARLTREKEQA